jgi:Zn-finger protein
LGEDCGGSFTYTADGVKDCTKCLHPHRRENYAKICEKMKLIIERTKKQPDRS